MSGVTRQAVILLLVFSATALPGCDWMWSDEARFDPRRCQKACPEGSQCIDGRCQRWSLDGSADRLDLSDRVWADSFWCKKDDLEPNDKLSAKAVTGHTFQLSICPAGDEDYLAVDMKASETLKVFIRFHKHLAALDLSVSCPDGNTSRATKSYVDYREVSGLTCTKDGHRIIRVWAVMGTTNEYTMHIIRGSK